MLGAELDPFGLVGQVLDGQFRVDKFVGEGGFSVVYRGHHVGLDEPIAIKCLKLPGALGSALVESFVRRFRDESRLHYRLSQGNLYIARSIASGTTMAPVTSALVPYMVLEWMEGRSLAQDFTTRRAQGQRGRSLAEVMKLLDPALDAIAYAHSQGVIHRDLNPGNLFLTSTREGIKLKVLDFGVAKIVSDHALAMGPRVQTIGQIRIFSPAYGSPEQFDDKIGKVGPWSDVYSLSLIMLEALSDRTVNEGEHIGEYAMRTLDEAWRPTPRGLGIPVGDEVESLLAQATSLIPAERPQDAGEFWGMMKNAVRKDADSGKAPFAVRTDSAPPRGAESKNPSFGPTVTLAMPMPSPVVEVARTESTLPPGASRPSATTLRMPSTPSPRMRSTQPMAAVPPNAAASQSGAWGANSSATYGAASSPSAPSAMHPSGGWGPGSSAVYGASSPSAPSAQPVATPLPTPFPAGRPIATPYPSFAAPAPPPPPRPSYPSSQLTRLTRPPPEPTATPRSRGMLIGGIVVFLLLLGAIAAVGYYLVLRKTPTPQPPAVGMLEK